jgi:serine/threonine protein kinase
LTEKGGVIALVVPLVPPTLHDAVSWCSGVITSVLIGEEEKQIVNRVQPRSISYGVKVRLVCRIHSTREENSHVGWYRPIIIDGKNRSLYIPLSSHHLWTTEKYTILRNNPEMSTVIIESFTEFYEGHYLCRGQSNASLTSSSSRYVELQLMRKTPQQESSNSSCTIPAAKKIHVKETISSEKYKNITLVWSYSPSSVSTWCNYGNFGIRYSAWSDLSDTPPENHTEVPSYDRFRWSNWTTIKRGATNFSFPFISTSMYYMFQLAIPKLIINPHNRWSDVHSNKYYSNIIFFGYQERTSILRVKPDTKVNVSLGTPVNLSCEARGTPMPTLFWVLTLTGPAGDVFDPTPGSIHPIKQARFGDEGKYICYASNTIITETGKEMQYDFKGVELFVYRERDRCMTSLSDTCAPYNNGTVSVAGKYVLTDMEKVAARLQVVLNSEQDRKCAQYIMEVFCRWSMPACTNNTPTPLCRQSCEDVRKKCSDLWRKATDVMHPELTPWRSCLDLTDDNITCITVDTGSLNPVSTSTPKVSNVTTDPTLKVGAGNDQNVLGVIGGIGFLLVLVLILAITVSVYCWCSKQKSFGDIKPIPLNNEKYTKVMKKNNHYIHRPNLLSISEKDFEKWNHIDPSNINIIEEIGQGNFGIVFKAEVKGMSENDETTTVAAKSLFDCDTEHAFNLFLHEAKIMFRFNHPNIVQLYGVCLQTPPYYLIFEYMSEGDLNDYLQQRAGSELKRLMNPSIISSRTESSMSNEPAGLTQEQLLFICTQIARGMAHLADGKHVHRDLATRNCLVGDNLVVKIGDFGMSQNLYHSDYYRVHGEVPLPVRWMAPESIIYGKFTSETDVWSFGIVMWEVFSFAMQPYFGHSNEKVCDLVRSGVTLTCPENCPPKVFDLMRLCWEAKPDNRPTIHNLSGQLETLRNNKMDSPLSYRDSQSLSSHDSELSNVFDTPSQSPSLGPHTHCHLDGSEVDI